MRVIGESDLWRRHGRPVLLADRFEGLPCFYPVYRYRDTYSYGVLPLIRHKGHFSPNRAILERAARGDFVGGNETIDREIERIGGPHGSGREIRSPEAYVAAVADAMIGDLADIEAANDGYTNVLMCGGRDSLNMLLLPWRNPVVAISAEPNFPLVAEFIRSNGLRVGLMKLEDGLDDPQEEILACCCRMDMQQWRWLPGLKAVAERYGGRAIFWKGQLGNRYLTNQWMDLVHPRSGTAVFARRLFRNLRPVLPAPIGSRIGRRIQAAAIRAAWQKSAVMQGCHMGFIRELVGCLVLSAYHGPKMASVLGRVDLSASAVTDLRPRIGQMLANAEVTYPGANPRPVISIARRGLEAPELFMNAISTIVPIS